MELQATGAAPPPPAAPALAGGGSSSANSTGQQPAATGMVTGHRSESSSHKNPNLFVRCQWSGQGTRAASVPANVPTGWNPKDKFHMLELSGENNTRVTYTGPGKTDADAAAIRANAPIPACVGVYYYEVTVLDAGRDGYIGIGLCTMSVNLNRLPGWERNSFGYHGDDGNSFRESGRGNPYGPTFTTGDVIGCGIDFAQHHIFYTVNGVHRGVAFRDVKGLLYPTVGLRTPGEVLDVNFGQHPFVYDIDAHLTEQRLKVKATIESTPIPRRDTILANIVISYLVHQGYSGSASLLAEHCGTSATAQADLQSELESITQRQTITKAVLAGDIQRAVDLTNQVSPQILANDRQLLFKLKCQQFVELIQQRPLEETMKFGREELSSFEAGSAESNAAQEVFSLLAYPKPSESPVAYLLEASRREPVANALNSAILVFQKKPAIPVLERLVKQVSLCSDELANSNVPYARYSHEILRSYLDLNEPMGR
eukprot:TRINITY_DN28717_c0_g1_i1.p1 TRINITY_DN28717_c0_g1~~TRINITY_DN28717_c0_g1_i1.p1  ORF type:complete len:485 (-),score=81.42 TRINITY_DN28717_c0_g1_i1:181-1635(-)